LKSPQAVKNHLLNDALWVLDIGFICAKDRHRKINGSARSCPYFLELRVRPFFQGQGSREVRLPFERILKKNLLIQRSLSMPGTYQEFPAFHFK
jgi:hypothetical protein